MQTRQTTSTNHQHELTFVILWQIWEEGKKNHPQLYHVITMTTYIFFSGPLVYQVLGADLLCTTLLI